MSDQTEKHCHECGTTLLPHRRYCLACQAPVPNAAHQPDEQHADQLADQRMDQRIAMMRHIASTRLPDKTLIFVPELRDARLKREHRNRRILITAMASCLLLTIIAVVLWRTKERQKSQAQQQRRETMARRELDRYAQALDLFFTDAGRYPTTKEGLGALLKRPLTLAAWRGPYIDGDFSIDPWGNDYVYHVLNEGTGYELSTFGPEGEAAGRAFLQVNAGSGKPNTTKP